MIPQKDGGVEFVAVARAQLDEGRYTFLRRISERRILERSNRDDEKAGETCDAYFITQGRDTFRMLRGK